MSLSAPAAKVRLLDPHTINQIAAGEVVERPASVVKELVENALDAGARRLIIELEEAGRRLIRVADDGFGMSAEDALAAMERHATSKIRAIDDLAKTTSLGFRGEALPSIASVSRFTLSTGVEDGLRALLRVEGGVIEPLSSESGPRGTTVTVEDLFFNTPARLKFLKTDATEMGQIVELVGKYAVAYPDVSFRLVNHTSGSKGGGGRPTIESHGGGDVLEALAAVWGRDTVRSLAGMEAIRDGVRVRGFVSGPDFTRPTRSQQWIFVNGRPVRNRSLYSAIDAAMRQLTPEKRFPVALILLDVEPARVDMNVSPTKSECRFQHEGAVFDAVRAAVKDALLANGMVPSAEGIARANEALAQYQAQAIPWVPRGRQWPGEPGGVATVRPGEHAHGEVAPTLGFPQSAVWARPDGGPAACPSSGVQLGPNGESLGNSTNGVGGSEEGGVFGASEGGAYGGTHPGPQRARWDAPPVPLPGTDISGQRVSDAAYAGVGGLADGAGSRGFGVGFSRFLDGLRIYGQTADAFFILAENRDGVMIIDQHVAHERILFEKLRNARGQAPLEKQPLLSPIPIELDRRLAEVARERIQELALAGFDLEPFGEFSYLLRAIPAALKRVDPAEALRDLLEDLVDGTRGSGLSAREHVWVTCSCKMAIKAGEVLSMPEIEKLLLDLGETENPYLCPHGRPITIMLARSDLLRKFKRT